MNQDQPSSGIEQQIESVSLRDSVERAGTLSLILAFLFGLYSASSLNYIQRFAPEITLWQNLWPRILLSTLPLILLWSFVRNSKLNDKRKLYFWITGFSLVLHATAWIHVWTIGLTRAPEILIYVHPGNIFLYGAVFTVVAPPRRHLIGFTSILILLFVVPLFFVIHRTGDQVLFNSILNDSLIAFAASIFFSQLVDKLRRNIAKLEIEKESQASKFLGPVLSKAIFENQTRSLEQIRCQGLVISIDIRDSTELQKKYRGSWLAFRREYFALTSRLTGKYSGYIQKTVGDAHVINFGVMDYGVDLSDIPGIESDLARAEERRITRATENAFGFLEELFNAAGHLAKRHFPNDEVLLGAGIDRGLLERGVQGDASLGLELDVNGDAVNCSSRLQEYSKIFRTEFPGSSIFIVSPYAADFLKDARHFKRVSTTANPIRNYSQIRWVLVRAIEQGASRTEIGSDAEEQLAA